MRYAPGVLHNAPVITPPSPKNAGRRKRRVAHLTECISDCMATDYTNRAIVYLPSDEHASSAATEITEWAQAYCAQENIVGYHTMADTYAEMHRVTYDKEVEMHIRERQERFIDSLHKRFDLVVLGGLGAGSVSAATDEKLSALVTARSLAGKWTVLYSSTGEHALTSSYTALNQQRLCNNIQTVTDAQEEDA